MVITSSKAMLSVCRFGTPGLPDGCQLLDPTDIDHFDWMLAETARVLRPDGEFLFYGVHPCFNGPHVEAGPDRSRIVHTTYRAAERHTSSPWWGEDGIRVKAGGMRHLPLADFINAFVDAGLRIASLHEPDEEPMPYAIVVKAKKAA